MFEWKQILTHETIKKIRVVYLMDYEPVWKNDMSKEISYMKKELKIN